MMIWIAYSWNEIKSESDAEFMEDHGLVKEVTSLTEDNTIDPIDCYRHFITDEIIDLMVRETNRYAERACRILTQQKKEFCLEFRLSRGILSRKLIVKAK